MDEQKAQDQFINIALQLTPALIRNTDVKTAEEAVQLYVQVYDAVIRAATSQAGAPAQGQPSSEPASS